jgi:2-amino-4-hydroxy-6-hydroxymethyldihydropteridine diphosphokinase
MMREAATWVPAYIGLGSNIDDPVQQLYRALDALRQLPQSHLVAVSGFFRNPPMGPPEQPWFINAAAGLLTRLSAAMLLAELKGIERRHGREPSAELRWGPRVLDLDLLVFGSAQIREGRLVVPHPGIRERNFVMFPLLEIAPGLTIPGLGPIRMLSSALDRTTLEAIG